MSAVENEADDQIRTFSRHNLWFQIRCSCPGGVGRRQGQTAPAAVVESLGPIMLDRELILAWVALCGLLALTLWAFGDF
jgi:hypothetical protein